MNQAVSNTAFEVCRLPVTVESPFQKPKPMIDDPDHLNDEVHLFSVPRPTDDPVPESSHVVLGVASMVVSAPLIRKMEYELRNDQCDPRTVFNSCRGLARGSREFEEAYIAARIRSFAKHQRRATDPFLAILPYTEERPVNYSQHIMAGAHPVPSHPMAVNHLGNLMSHFGIWVIGLLGTQLLAAWRIGAFAETYLEGGRTFYFTVTVFLMLALDSTVWFRRRGSLCYAFLVPGAALYAMALLPVVLLHLRETLLAVP